MEGPKAPSERLAQAIPRGPALICEIQRKVRVHVLLSDVEFHEQLWRVDVEMAERVRCRGCPRPGHPRACAWRHEFLPRQVLWYRVISLFRRVAR